MTDHARERCTEMGISTKVAKRIVQYADATWTHGPKVLAVSDRHPAYTVVYVMEEDQPVVCTVLFRRAEDYVRDERGAYLKR